MNVREKIVLTILSIVVCLTSLSVWRVALAVGLSGAFFWIFMDSFKVTIFFTVYAIMFIREGAEEWAEPIVIASQDVLLGRLQELTMQMRSEMDLQRRSEIFGLIKSTVKELEIYENA
jgi:hypothetical protein